MSTLRVIFVHGISDILPKKADYTDGFEARLHKELEKIGVIPPNATEDEIKSILTCEPAYYADIGAEQEEELLEAYHHERDQDHFYGFLDQALDTVAFDKARRFFITSASDVLLYQDDACKDLIRKRVLDTITPYINTGDPVTIVAHSLGSVVAFDLLYYYEWYDWKPLGFKPANLFTLGSPIALFSLATNTAGQPKTKYDPAVPMEDPNLVQPEGVWYNFLDAQDLIGYPLEYYFRNKYKVKDILVQTGTSPIEAHTAYWKNEKVLHTLAERLKLDFERTK